MSPLVIRRAILNELKTYGSGLTPSGLHQLIKLSLPATALADVVEEITWLRDHELIVFTPSPLDADDRSLRQWTITTAGELILKK
jgi:hypothetical protein